MAGLKLESGESMSFLLDAVRCRASANAMSNGLGELVLTNMRIAFVPRKANPFGKDKGAFEIPLSEVAMRGSHPQIEVSRPGGRAGGYIVTIYSQTAKEDFTFPCSSDREAMQFVERVYENLVGSLDGYDPQAIGFNASVNKKIAGFVSAAKPIATDLMDIAKPLIGTATTATIVGASAKSNLFGKVLGVAEVVADKVVAKPASDPATSTHSSEAAALPESESVACHSGEMSLDDQIETLRKLKGLVDAGILTQDEFDAKKKQIMGL